MTTINPKQVAAKLKALRDAAAPGLAHFTELVWFIQSASLRPGGLESFAQKLLTEFPEKFQTHGMMEAGPRDQAGRYTLAQCLVVWKDITRKTDPFFNSFIHDVLNFEAEYRDNPSAVDVEQMKFKELALYFIDADTSPADAVGDSLPAVALRSAFKRFNFAWLKQNVQHRAADKLPQYLADVCQIETTQLRGTNYCPDLPALLANEMERHATAVKAQLAQTVVTTKIFHELEFAYSERVPVPIVGESRFGKTTSIKSWCDSYPGRVRMVIVPESNREVDFIRAHADALGIDYTTSTPLGVLKPSVEFVLNHAGLMVVYDEAHYLIPIRYKKDDAPGRVNWVRAKLIDRDVPCAFFATPQSYDQTLEKYAKATGYRMEQWLGRMAPPVILSDVIPDEQFFAVARKHFPEMADALLEQICERAIRSDGYLKNVELVGRRARFLARERGHAVPRQKDVMDAIDEMMPPSPRVINHQPEGQPAEPLPPRRSQPAAAQRVAPVHHVITNFLATNKTLLVLPPEMN